MPVRIQRKRTKGWAMPENTVYVGRGSKWGNPFTADEYGHDNAVTMHALLLKTDKRAFDLMADIVKELRGKNLACWCKESQRCHADTLLDIANG